jgi:hypothetical protein
MPVLNNSQPSAVPFMMDTAHCDVASLRRTNPSALMVHFRYIYQPADSHFTPGTVILSKALLESVFFLYLPDELDLS